MYRVKCPSSGSTTLNFPKWLIPVDLPKYEMGRFACNMLMDVLGGKTVDVKEIVLQPQLITRQSVIHKR
jgi:DNA-binding LacI/PurR family transcriptional regulator